MTSEVIVDVQPNEISIALLEDKRLVEFQKEGRSASFVVGNIYLAKVRKLMPGAERMLCERRLWRDAFLHYLDLGPKFNSYTKYLKQVTSDKKKLYPFSKASILPDLEKDGSVQTTLQQGQEILVQIVKEPISTKGPQPDLWAIVPRTFSGTDAFPRQGVRIFQNKISRGACTFKTAHSKHQAQKLRCYRRTVAEGKRVAELDSELKVLVKRCEDAFIKAQKASKLPELVFEETSPHGSHAAGFVQSFVWKHLYQRYGYFQRSKRLRDADSPGKCGHRETVHRQTAHFRQLWRDQTNKSSFGKTVSYKHGAYLIIEHTEALHVVDVNSGNRSKSKDGQEANALDVNLGAADELARQLRLRDMGGIIVVDFIDMNLAEDRQKLYERMCENMKKDRARHNILPLSKFGLMQITRQRVRPVMDVNVDEVCPTCFGKGTVKSSFLFTDVLESKISTMANKLGIKNFTLHVHRMWQPTSIRASFPWNAKWQVKYGFGLKVIPSQKLGFLQYEFYDKNGQEIDMKEEIEIKH